MPFGFHFVARSDVGMVRSNNEDSGYAGPHLLAMADGMGGHAGGDVASSTIITALVDLDHDSISGADVTRALVNAIHDGNAELGERINDDDQLKGMGTTLIAMLRARDKLVLAHIGDSRAFLARGGKVTQITKDHSFVQSLVDEGRLTPEEAMTHPQRSLVTRVLTGSPDDEPDIVVRHAKMGDRYLIASDGLTDYVARDTIDEILLDTPKLEDCADRLVQLALRAGAPDNVTVVMADVIDLSKGGVPSDQPVVVGAAALRRNQTRPILTSPAAKAAALTKAATGIPDEEPITLAEEEPHGRLSRVLRLLAGLAVLLIVLAGGTYAAWAWSQQQLFVATDQGKVAVFRGVDQTLGPIALSSVDWRTDIVVADLPDFYQSKLKQGISVDNVADADSMLSNLDVQARACRYAKTQGRDCGTVPSNWTEPTPSPSPSPSVTPTPSASPSVSASPRANTPTPARTPLVPPSPGASR
jgi:serine/threonine protein phosphatase PrpC